MSAIEVRSLSKRYRRGAIGVRSLREELELFLSRRRGRQPKPSIDEFYALKDVTFSVPSGSVCGIIGRNGSGKTTLLKVLTSITAPEFWRSRPEGPHRQSAGSGRGISS